MNSVHLGGRRNRRDDIAMKNTIQGVIPRKKSLQKPFDNIIFHTGNKLVLSYVVNFTGLQLYISVIRQNQQALPCIKRCNIVSIYLVFNTVFTIQTLMNTVHVLVPPKVLAIHS